MSREQKLEEALLQIKDRVEKTICPTFSSSAGDLGEMGRISRQDFDTLLLAALSAPKAEAVTVKPRLTDAAIREACKAHFGSDMVDGINVTAKGVDWTFRQAFKRMWDGAWSTYTTSPVPALTDEAVEWAAREFMMLQGTEATPTECARRIVLAALCGESSHA